jgi:hypothetical protein
MIRPSDPSVIPSPEFRSDFFERSDPIGPGIGFIDLGKKQRQGEINEVCMRKIER